MITDCAMNDELQLDPETLQMLRDVMEADFPRLIETFIRDSAAHLQDIAGALAQGDSDGARRAAHSFKGSSSNIGAQRLSALCRDIERSAREGRLDALHELLTQVEQEFSSVSSQLQSHLTS